MGLRVMWLYLILALLARRAVSWNDRRSAEDYKNDEDSYKGRLIYLQILTSNGFHAPLELYPGYKNTENAWPEGLGQLTKLGKLQHYQLGKMLRKRYQNIITSDPREVDVFSSFEDRTISSTLCLLASLYAPSDEWRFMPNYNWQPIPVSCVEGESDKYLGYDAFCPKRKEELKKIIKSGPGQEFLKKHEFLYSYLTNHTGLPMDDWNDVVRLFDTLSREHQVGLKVPYWARNFWKDMKQITDASYRWNFKSKLSLKTKTGSLINLMLDRMKVKTQQDDPDPSIKVDVYVTHDWNIASFLASMLRFNGLRPPPCATITMELYSNFDSHTVRMLFFNSTTPELGYQEPHVLTLNGCTEYCPLAYVTNSLHDYIPKNWRKLCGLSAKAKEDEGEESGPAFSLSDEKKKP